MYQYKHPEFDPLKHDAYKKLFWISTLPLNRRHHYANYLIKKQNGAEPACTLFTEINPSAFLHEKRQFCPNGQKED